MKLLNGNQAIVDVQKLRNYCLNRNHPRGRHKARVFEAALGLTQADAEEFVNILREAALQYDVEEGISDQFGSRYAIKFECRRGRYQAFVRSSWIILKTEEKPRFVTAYVILEN